jgi:hypothetical protein
MTEECKHEWRWIRGYDRGVVGVGWQRSDVFYCVHCLDLKEIPPLQHAPSASSEHQGGEEQ